MTAERQLLADRVHKYWAQREFIYDALTGADGFLEWFHQAPGETRPVVLTAVPTEPVVWASLWPVTPSDTIEFDLKPYFAGTALRVRWWSPHPPDERGIGITRHRINRYLGAELRGWLA